MSDIKTILQEFVATANDPKVGSAEKALGYFPEFGEYDKKLLYEYLATANDPKLGRDFEKVNRYFPELFKQASGGAPMRPEQTVPSLVPGMEFPVQEAPKSKPVVGVIGNTLRGANGLIGMPEVGTKALNFPDPKTGAFTPEVVAAYRGEKAPIQREEPNEKPGITDYLKANLDKINAGASTVIGGAAKFMEMTSKSMESVFDVPYVSDYYEWAGKVYKGVGDYFMKDAKFSQDRADIYKGKDFTELWKEGRYVGAAGQVYLEAAQSIPQTLETIVLVASGAGTAALPAMYMQTAGAKYDDLEERTDLSEANKQINAHLSGLVEAASEKLGDVPVAKWIVGKMGIDGAQQAVASAFETTAQKLFKKAGLLAAPIAEGISEAASELGTKVVDLATGASKEFTTDGILQAFVYGAAGGSQFAAVGAGMDALNSYGQKKQKREFQKVLRATIQAEHERVSTEIAAIANKDMQEVQTVKLATGEVVNLTGGRIARKEDGTLDFDNSDKVLYYTNAEGVTKPVSIGMVESLETAQPLESAVAEAKEAVTTVEIGKANYPQGDSFVLLNADGSPQLGETGQPVATTIAGVDQTGVTLATAEGQEVKLTFEEADAMLAPLSEHLPNLTGKRYQVNGLEMVVTGVNERGQYEVQVWNKDTYLGEEAVSAQELSALEPQQPQQVAGLTENVLTENVNPQPEFPVSAEGFIDFDSIKEPVAFAEALKKEFGEEEAGITATELLDEAKDELEKARAKTNAIERRRGMKAATDKIALLEGVKTALQPKTETPVVNLDDIAPEVVTNETEKDLSLLSPNELIAEFEKAEGAKRTEVAFYLIDEIAKALKLEKVTAILETTDKFISALEAWSGKIPEKSVSAYRKAMGAHSAGRAFINMENVKGIDDLFSVWAHEHGHSISDVFSDTELKTIFDSSNPGVIKYITGGNYTELSETKQAEEAICHALEFYMRYGAKELSTGAINDIQTVLEGQDALNEAVFKVLRILTKNDNHGKDWDKGRRNTPVSKSDGSGGSEVSGANEPGDGNSNEGTSGGNNEPGTEGVRREASYSNGAQVRYKGETYTINGVGRDLESGAISYDLETPEGKTAFEDVSEDDLLNQVEDREVSGDKNSYTIQQLVDIQDKVLAGEELTPGEAKAWSEEQYSPEGFSYDTKGGLFDTNPTAEVVETPTADPLQSLKDEHSKMLEDAAAIRDEAAKITGPERFKAYGRAGAILSKAKKLAEKIAEIEATAVDKAVVEQQPNLNPTEAQKVAGNYKKTHVTVQGLEITIENPKGSIRKGVDEDGKAWENEVKSHYGYFKRTEGKDGDHVDVFVGDKLESPKVFVIDQVFDKGPKSGLFDESKVMIGFETLQEATDAYMANYDPDWSGLSDVTEVSIDFFKKWLYDGKKQGKPFADYKEVKELDEYVPTVEEEKAERAAEMEKEQAAAGVSNPTPLQEGQSIKKVSDKYYTSGSHLVDNIVYTGCKEAENAKPVTLVFEGDFFSHTINGKYYINEASTGVKITLEGHKTLNSAKIEANQRLNENGEAKLKEAIARQQKQIGITPRYEVSEPQTQATEKDINPAINPARLKDHAELRAMRESTHPEFNNTPTLINLDAFVDRVKELDTKSKEDEYWYEKGFRYMITISFPHSLGEMGNTDSKFVREKPTLKSIEAYVLDNLKTTLELSKDSGSARDERLVERIQEALDYVKTGDKPNNEAPAKQTFTIEAEDLPTLFKKLRAKFGEDAIEDMRTAPSGYMIVLKSGEVYRATNLREWAGSEVKEVIFEDVRFPVKEAAPVEFTFMASSPMNKARAITTLEKLIRDRNGRVIPMYQWLEEMPRGLKIATEKVHSRNDKGYVEKRVIGDHIIDTKAEEDYYKYLEEGGTPYSKYLEAERVKEAKQAELDKIERAKRLEADKIKEAEDAVRIKAAELRGLKELLTTDVQELIRQGNEPLEKELKAEQKKNPGAQRDMRIGQLERMIEQHERISKQNSAIARELFELGPDGEPRAKYNYKVGDPVIVTAWNPAVETKIARVKDLGIRDNFPAYEVEPRDGIHNVHLSYTTLRPVEGTTPDKPTKKVEYKDGRTAEGREAAMQALRDKLAAEKAKNATPGNVANLRMVDTVILSAGFEVAPYIFDEGNIAFPDFANALISEVGDDIIPHLQGIYLGVKYTPTAAEIRGDMSDIAEIEGYIKDLLDKQNNSGKTDVSLQSEKGDTFLKDHIIVAKPGLTPTNNETNSGRMGDSSPVEISGKPSDATTGVSQGEPRDAATVDRGQSANRTGVDEERTGTQGGSSVREGSSNINAGASGGTVGSTGSANKREQNEGNSQAITSTGPRNSRNYVIPRGADVAPRGDVSKVRANIAAIKLAKKLAESGLTATPEQMEVLVKYTGWGGLSNVFKQADPNYQAVRDALTDEEYDAARASTTTAFYTPPAVIAATWDAIEQLGFKGGEILEPSGGIGHFFGLMPANIASVSNLRGVELDNISGLIFKALYPDAKIAIEGFEKQRIANNSLDLVVTNVPFGDFKVHDKEDKDLSSQFNIHDYFIAKGVRKLKPGGIGVFITTSSTLDKSSGLRSWVINEGNADFIDAVRLNSDTFKQAAGTEATADIIIIRKRDVNGKPDYAKNMQDVVNLREASYMEDKKTSWGGYAGTEEKKVQIRINKFFADNPDRMAGEMKFGFEGGNAIRPTEQRLAPVKGIEQAQVLADFVKGLPTSAFGAKAVTSKKVVESDGTKEGGLTVINGVPYIIRFGEAVATGWNENKVKGSTKAQVVEQYAGIKKTLNELLDAERVDSPTMEGLRKELNKKYDKFVDQFGPLSKNNNLVFLRSDVDFPAISAIEDVKTSEDPETGRRVVEVTKSDIFSKRVMNPEQVLRADNVEDAMRVSMYKHGAVDLNYIEELTGISPEDAKKEIVEKRIGFVNPTTGLVETRKDYLSGNVRVKLEQAEQANENNDYDSNVEELSKVIPLDVPQHMIKAALGSTWIPMEAYEHFFKETFGVEGKIIKTSSDKYLANLRGENNAKDAELGVPGHPGSTLALNYMNNKPTIVYRYEGYGRDRKQVKDAAASTEAATKAADIAEAFDNWARSNANPFGEKMTAAYNKIFNAVVEPKRDVAKAYDRGFAIVKESPYFQEALAKEPEVERATAMAFVAAVQDMGSKLPEAVKAEFESIRGQVVFPGQATAKVLRAHQVEGVLRGLQASTLLAHEVGTGKTMTLITTAMEMRRLGMAKKPCIVVQRATYEQFVKEIKELYPQAKVLVPASDDLKASERQQLFAKIAYNDWDIVVLYHGYLDAIPDDPNRVNQYIDELIQEKLDLMEEISASGDVNSKRMAAGIATQIKGLESKYLPTDNKKEKSVKTIEKAKAKAGAKAETLLDRRTDNTLTFEQLGIDALLIDEAHAYKKLGFNTALQSVKGVDTGASQRAQSMRLKSSYILENNNGKNVIFATGTPISNTFAEMWTFLRYLMPKSELSRLQMNNFDAFVNNFGNIEESVEFSASGKFKPTTRFTGFANVPELISAWKQVAHTVLTEDIPTLREGVGTPVVEGGKPTDVVLKQSPSLKGVMRSIKDVLTNFENMSGAEKKENKHIPIVMFQVAKRAAIDVRLVDSALPDEPLSKTNQTVVLVLADLEKTKDYKGTVAVFCDALQSRDGKFKIFEDIKAKLIKAGVPENQIAIVQDLKDDKREAVWDKVNAGDIRVVMGSTEKMGVGVNIQKRLHALIHMDVPVRPSDYQQRNGRIIRQGNLHLDMRKNIEVLRLGVVQTLDVTGYNRLDIKKKGSDQIMKGSNEGREMEEEDVDGVSDSSNFSETMGKISGSQAAMLLATERTKLKKLENSAYYHDQNQIHIASELKYNANMIPTTEARIKELEAQKEKLNTLFGGTELRTLKVGDKEVSFDDEAGVKALLSAAGKAAEKEADRLKADPDRMAEKTSKLSSKISINGVEFEVTTYVKKGYNITEGKPTSSKKVVYTCDALRGFISSDPSKDRWDIENGLLLSGDAGAKIDNLLPSLEDFVATKALDRGIQRRKSSIEDAKRATEVYKGQLGKPFPKAAELERVRANVAALEIQMKKELEEIEAEEAAEIAAGKITAIDISGAVESEDGGVMELPPNPAESYYSIDAASGNFVVRRDAKPIELEDKGEYFIYEIDGRYYIAEATTGIGITSSYRENTAVNDANMKIKRAAENGKPIEQFIQERADKAGYSPRYIARNKPMLRIAGDTPKGTVTVNGVERPVLNSNGKLIHSTEEGIRNFYNWFGDSVVKNKKGQAAVMYHGTNADFSEFDSRMGGTNTGAKNGVLGSFFTDSPKVSQSFGNSVMPVYLKIEKPIEIGYFAYDAYGNIDKNKTVDGYEGIKAAITKIAKKESYADVTDEDILNWKELVKKLGYDGLVIETQVDATEVVSTGKMAGYVKPHKMHIVFEPSQIKSATGNDGGFDPDNNDIRFRLITIPEKPKFKDFNGDLKAYALALKDFADRTSEIVPEMEAELNAVMNKEFDEFLRNQQDADLPIKNLQNFIAEQGGVVQDIHDAYNDKNRSIGRSTYKAQEFEKNEIKNLADAYKAIIKESKLESLPEVPLSEDTTPSIRKIGAYLQAKDIVEALNLGLVDRGELGFLQDVGVTAQEYIKAFETAVAPALVTNLHKAVKAATLYGLDRELEAGLMTAEDYANYAARQYYVPQRGWEERDSKEGETHYLKQGHVYGDPYNAVLVKAKGRESLASDPLKYIQSMGHSAILTGEKNLYKQKALQLVKDNIEIGRASGGFNFKRVWYVNTGTKDAGGNIIYDEVFERPAQQLFDEDVATYALIKQIKAEMKIANEAAAIDELDDLRKLLEEAVDNIHIKFKVNDAYKRQRTSAEAVQHEVVVYVNGERMVVYFKDERLANALNNKSEEFTLPRFMQLFGKATRFYSSIMTQYNPAFAGWNFMRDFQLANIALFAEQGPQFAAKFNKNIFDPAVSGAIWRHIAGKENFNKANHVMLKNFFEDGAATGFTYLKDLDQIQKDLRKAIEPTLLQSTAGSQLNVLNGKAVGKAFAALTEYSELVTRFATYKTALEVGRSREQAATIAKDVTVNFNRKGANTKILSSLFAFYNASVQGTYRAARLAEFWKVFGSVVGIMVVGGFLNTLFNPNDPEDEKNWSEYDRMQNVILFGVKLPVTHFFRGFWAMGVQTALAYQGEKSVPNALFDAAKAMTSEIIPAVFNPLNAARWDAESGIEWRTPREGVPSVIAPMVDVAINESFTGARVYREPITDGDKIPQAFLGKRDVSPLTQSISNFLLEAGGGDSKIKDLYLADGSKVNTLFFDVNPSAMEYLATSYTGGVGKFAMDSYKSIAHIAETGEVDVARLPIVNRAVKPYNEDRVFYAKYSELMNKVKAFENSTSVRKKAFVQEGEAYNPAISDFLSLMTSQRGRMVFKAKALQKQVESLQDVVDTMRANGKAKEADEYSKELTSKVKEVNKLLEEWNNIKE